ncbi:MAG: PrsW family glutamic-type intramembrane protease [Treponema sp.]|nr:PrsW family glutamic-type intramembrane protease [Treponema sp.]
MYGSWVLLIIILISAIPVIAVYVWYRLAKYQISNMRFLSALLAGAASLFPALVLQRIFDFPGFIYGRLALFYEFFIRIAFTEELSRLLILLLFFFILKYKKNDNDLISNDQNISSLYDSKSTEDLSINQSGETRKATAIGLVAGLGFALLENAVYAAADTRVLPMRIIITAAVHGACGSRIGAAAVMIRSNTFQAIMRILTATAIHGIYNLMANMPGFSPILAVLIALSALLTSISAIAGGFSKEPAAIDKSSENS